jgi:hypothetical protein
MRSPHTSLQPTTAVATVDGSVHLDGQQACAAVAVLLTIDARDHAFGNAHVVAPLGKAHHHDLGLREVGGAARKAGID